MSFLKHSSYSFLSVISRAGASFIVNKLFAVYLGASGITILAHFQNFIAMGTQIPNDGINRGLIKFLSVDDKGVDIKRNIFSAAIILNLVIYMLFLVLIFLFDNYFFSAFEELLGSTWMIISLVVFLLFFLLYLLMLSYLLALQKIKAYSFLQILSSISMVFLVYYTVHEKDLNLALLGFLGGQGLGIIFCFLYAPIRIFLSRFVFSFDWHSIKDLSQFILMAVSVLAFGRFLDFVIRDFAIEQYGLDLTGLWQAVVKVSDSYLMLYIGAIGVVIYPKISSLISVDSKLREYVSKITILLAPIILTGLLMVYFLREFILLILFSAEFSPAEYLFIYQLPGNLFQMISIIFVYIVSAQARVISFVLLQLFSAVIYGAALIILLQYFEIAAFPFAYSIRHFLFLIAVLFVNRKLIFQNE
jgi:polysaccharide transporter, PST family